MPTTGLTGNLKTMTLPDLLQWSAGGRKTGTLCLFSERFEKRIYFQGGAIIGSSSNDPREYLGQFLLSEGLISEGQLKTAFDLQARTHIMLGRILVKNGLLSETKVAEILRLKAEETIYSLFLWTEADFKFLEDELPPGEQVLVSVRVEDILMEGLRRYDTAKKIREVLPHNGVILGRSSSLLPSDIASKALPKRLYDLVDGNRELADIILEAHASEFNVCQILYVMVLRGFLEVKQEAGPRPVRAPRAARPPIEGPETLITTAKELLQRGDPEAALALLEKARGVVGKSPEINALVQVAEEHFIERAYIHYLPAKKIPILKQSLESLVDQELSPEEVFLVSRVNGSWDLKSIISISPLREVDALRALKKLRESGIIDLIDAQAKTA